MCSKDDSLKSARSIIRSLQEELEFFREKMYDLQIKNAELEKLSITDDLTGLYNQRYFHKALKEAVNKHKYWGKPLCLLFFDVDNLKSYNDTYGHLGGDSVLVSVADCLVMSIKNTTGSAYRYGGDEFAAIIPFADTKSVIGIIKRISNKLKTSSLGEISLSFGIANFSPEMNAETLFRHADDAMYMAKKGRSMDSDSSSDKIYVYD